MSAVVALTYRVPLLGEVAVTIGLSRGLGLLLAHEVARHSCPLVMVSVMALSWTGRPLGLRCAAAGRAAWPRSRRSASRPGRRTRRWRSSSRATVRLFLRCGRLGGGAEFPGGALTRFLGRLQLRLHGLELTVTPVEVVSGGADCVAVFLQAGSQLFFRLRCLVKSTLGAVQGFSGWRRRRLFRPRAARIGARSGLLAAGR
jgi:hypothetical protein